MSSATAVSIPPLHRAFTLCALRSTFTPWDASVPRTAFGEPRLWQTWSPGGTVSASASVRLGPFLLPPVGCCKTVGRMLPIDSLPVCWPSCLASCFTSGLPHLCVPRPRPRCLPQRIPFSLSTLRLLLSHPIQTLALRAPIVLTARPPTMHLRHHLASPAPCPLVGLCYSSRHLKPPSLKPHVLFVLEASCGVSCRLRFCATTAPLSRACCLSPITLTYALSCPPLPSG